MLARGANRHCLNFKFEDSPECKFYETIVAAQGTLERKQNARQTLQKMRARLEQGYWVFRAPNDYKHVKSADTGKDLVSDEPLASVIRETLEGYACGRLESQAEVNHFLEDQPLLPNNSKGFLPQQRVTELITNPRYADYICHERYGIKWLKVRHEPLISLEMFEKIQQRRSGKPKAAARKNLNEDFPLRGFVLCDDCQKPLTARWSKGRLNKYPYYLCQTKTCESYGKSIPRDKLEGEVGDIIKSLQPNQTLFGLVKKMFEQAWNQRLVQAEDALKSARRQIKALEKKTEYLLARIVETTNPSVINAYEGKIADLELNRLRLEEQMANRALPTGTFEEKLEPALLFLANAWKLWETGQITVQRAVLRLAFTERLAYHQRGGARTPKTSLVFKALRGDSVQGVWFGAPCRT